MRDNALEHTEREDEGGGAILIHELALNGGTGKRMIGTVLGNDAGDALLRDVRAIFGAYVAAPEEGGIAARRK